MTYPYTGVQFDEDGNPVDRDPAAIYRPRDVAAPKQPTPQAASSTGDTPDNSTLYRPRYVEENPNNFGAQLAAATRPGSILNIIGTMTGGAQSAAAHKYNAAERMKFEDSVAQMRLALEQRRIQNEEARSNAPSRYTTWQDDVIAKWKNHEITDEQALAMLHGQRQAPAQKPRTVEDILNDPNASPDELKTAQDRYRFMHPPTERPAPAGSFDFMQVDTDGDGTPDKIVNANRHTGTIADAPGAPSGGVTRIGTPRKDRLPFDAKAKEVELVQDFVKKNGKPPNAEEMASIKQAIAMMSRASGRMPDQRQNLPGKPGAPARRENLPASPGGQGTVDPLKKYVRTGTDNATGKRVGMLPDGTIEVIN